MPIYTFRCHHCEHRFDSLERYDTQAADCPDCGASCERAMHLHGMVKFYGGGKNKKSAGAFGPHTKREQRVQGQLYTDDYPMREAKRVG